MVSMTDEIQYTGSNDDEVLATVKEWFPDAEVTWGQSRPGFRELIVDGVTKAVQHGATLLRGIDHVYLDGDDA